MLKNCFLPIKYDRTASLSCGEIVCQSESAFTIVCKFCNIKIFEYQEFVQHFHCVHWHLVSKGFATEETLAGKQHSVYGIKEELNEQILYKECTVYETSTLSKTGDESIKQEEQASHGEDNLGEESNEYDSGEGWAPNKDDCEDSTDSEPINIITQKLKSQKKPSITFNCTLCPKSFTIKSSYQSHLKTHSTNRFKCDKCNKTFARETLLMNHLNSHNGYKCVLCTKVFKTYEQLRYHKETHVKTKDFVCDYKDCKKAFATKRRMNSHRRFHTSEDFVCEICGSKQRNKQALADHIRKHSGEKPYACTLCDRRFASKSLLNEHKACHETERKHVCDVCGKSFNRPKALYHHKPLHLGIKKFVCKICGTAYAQAAGLSAHMRKHRVQTLSSDLISPAENNIYKALFS